MAARHRRSRTQRYRTYRRPGHSIRRYHPSAVAQWNAIDSCGEDDITLVNEELSQTVTCGICLHVISEPINSSHELKECYFVYKNGRVKRM
eukprot:793402_1